MKTLFLALTILASTASAKEYLAQSQLEESMIRGLDRALHGVAQNISSCHPMQKTTMQLVRDEVFDDGDIYFHAATRRHWKNGEPLVGKVEFEVLGSDNELQVFSNESGTKTSTLKAEGFKFYVVESEEDYQIRKQVTGDCISKEFEGRFIAVFSFDLFDLSATFYEVVDKGHEHPTLIRKGTMAIEAKHKKQPNLNHHHYNSRQNAKYFRY